jgi:hypothetical protein
MTTKKIRCNRAMFKSKILLLKKILKTGYLKLRGESSDFDLDLMKDAALYRWFRNRRFSPFHVFLFFFFVSVIMKIIVSIIQGTAFSKENLNTLSTYISHSGPVIKQSLSWIVDIGWKMLSIFPASQKIDITYFSDYSDYIISILYISLHSVLIFVHWNTIPTTVEELYKNGNLSLSKKEFQLLKKDFNRRYNRFYYKIIAAIATGCLIVYIYITKNAYSSWWAGFSHKLCALYFLVSAFLIIYYMNLHVVKGFVSVRLVNHAISNKILKVKTMNSYECGGLKKVGTIIIQTSLSNTMTLSAIIIIYLSNYLPQKNPLYIFYLAIMVSFLPLFALVPLYKIHKIMEIQKKKKMDDIATLLEIILGKLTILSEKKVYNASEITELSSINEKLTTLYDHLKKLSTFPIKYRVGIFNALMYLLQIAVLVSRIIR